MTLLSIVQGAALRCNLKVPAQAFSSTDENVLQIIAFAEDSGRELVERGDWNELKVKATVTGDGVSTIFALPSDWGRLCPSDKSPVGALVSLSRPTIPLRGPVNDEALNQIKALTAFPAYPVWRFVNRNLEIWPALADGEVVSFWYFTRAWVISPQGIQSTRFTSDNDASLIDEDLIMKGAIWKWKRAKGLDYQEEYTTYEREFGRLAGQQDNSRVISTSTITTVDDTFWPGQITYTPL